MDFHPSSPSSTGNTSITDGQHDHLSWGNLLWCRQRVLSPAFYRKQGILCERKEHEGGDGRVLERHFLKEFLPAVPKPRTKALGTPKEPERSPVLPFVDQVFPQGHPGWPHTNISPSPPRHPLRFYQAPAVPDRSGLTVTPRWDGAIVPGAVCRCSGSTENPAALICGCDLPPLPPFSPLNRGRIYPGGKTSLGTVFFSEAESLFPPFCNLGWRRAGFYYSYLFFFYLCIPTTSPGKGPLSHTQD